MMETRSLFQKLLICLLAGLICGETFLRIGDRFLAVIISPPAVMVCAVLMLIMALVYAVVWDVRDKKNDEGTAVIKAFWTGAIRYGIAFDLAMFGFQKIFHLQFTTPLAMLDEPFSSFSSQWLTWSYFGHSYGFACVIGVSQILGSLLLVYSRTRLLGAVTLVPILVNIIFIDYFYALDFGVLLHAIILFAGLIYLLLLDANRLNEFFLRYNRDEVSVAMPEMLKKVVRLSILFIPLLLIAANSSPDKHPKLTGKYTVEDMKINGIAMRARVCGDSLLTNAYFDIADECVFEFNDQKRRMFGKYEFDERQGLITISWHFPLTAKAKQFKGMLKLAGDKVELKGSMGTDSIRVKLARLLVPAPI